MNSARLPFAPSRRAIQMTAEAWHVPVLSDRSMPRLPWLYSHGLAILAAARAAASGAQSPTRIHGSPRSHVSRYPHPPTQYPACLSRSNLPCPHVLARFSHSVCRRCRIHGHLAPVGRPRDGSGSPPGPGRSQVRFAPPCHSLWPASAHLCRWLSPFCWAVVAV